MSFNNKNEVVHKPVRHRPRLKKVKIHNSGGISDRLLEIGQDCTKRFDEPLRSAEHGDLLYNEKGLPK